MEKRSKNQSLERVIKRTSLSRMLTAGLLGLTCYAGMNCNSSCDKARRDYRDTHSTYEKTDGRMAVGCVDSDRGDNPYVKGMTKGVLHDGVYIEFTDRCFLAKDYFSGRYFELNPGVNPEDIGVAEGICGRIGKYTLEGKPRMMMKYGTPTGSNIIPGPNWHRCEYGCKDGACNL